MEDTAQKIFNGAMPTFSSKPYDTLQKCVRKIIPVEDKVCRTNFSGVASPKFKILAWPSKYVFNASVIDIAQVHVPDSFTDSLMISKNADGALLHFRYDAESKNLTTTEKPYRFFPDDNHSTHIKNMENTAQKIFNGVMPKFSSKPYDTLQECVNKIMKSEEKICVSTGGLSTSEVVHYINLNDKVVKKVGKSKKEATSLYNSHFNEKEDSLFDFKSSECQIEDWNNVYTDSIPNQERHKEWAEENLGIRKYLYHNSFALLGAFVYTDQIIVTLTAENQFNNTVYCRYYDCRRREIPDQFESVVNPESTVFCARRPGAKYISISKNLEEVPEYSIPIVPRIQKPPHYFTVCMATLYGDEPKFLQIVDFIEYYKLQGATFFHIYLRNVTDYDRVLLDDYVRTGDIEIIKMHDHHWRDDFMWHNAQINDCHHRNKYFSKWTSVIDVDERMEMRSDSYKTITSFLDSVTDPNIVNLHFKVQWIIKTDNTPARYENEKQLIEEMVFHKYQNLSQVGSFWNQPKCIIRPEKIGIMTIHAPLATYSGMRRSLVNESIGVVRHYRNVQQRVFAGALDRMMIHAPFSISPIAQWIDNLLTETILKRVKWVYDVVDVTCDQKQRIYQIHGGLNASCWLEQQHEKNNLAA
ncbi:hypothetical protein L5515_005835 [Caenorhabditis briggsae]|uniref:Glycosyltransferase family 92 protein n=1 Tax=Caenorhabditis briggsae TaxID=6238 RepID=A0AAE9EZU2_CAEBR|nr:hypothetical protein L5515_005835 [Caenorhabditis briggsae]